MDTFPYLTLTYSRYPEFSQHKKVSILFLQSLSKKATVYQITTMLATSKNVEFPGHNHLLTPFADDPDTLIIAQVSAMVAWLIVDFLHSECTQHMIAMPRWV